MNLKKLFKKEREHLEEKLYTEGDELYFNISQTKTKRRVKSCAWFSSLATILIATAVSVPIIILSLSPKLYQEENICNTVSSIEQLHRNVKYLTVESNLDSEVNVVYFFDKLSNDSLYYNIKIKNKFQGSDIYLVVNSNYSFNFKIKGETVSKQLNNYSIEYFMEERESQLSNAPMYKYSGWIKVETEIAYFTYEEQMPMDENYFFEDIQNIIRLK